METAGESSVSVSADLFGRQLLMINHRLRSRVRRPFADIRLLSSVPLDQYCAAKTASFLKPRSRGRVLIGGKLDAPIPIDPPMNRRSRGKTAVYISEIERAIAAAAERKRLNGRLAHQRERIPIDFRRPPSGWNVR